MPGKTTFTKTHLLYNILLQLNGCSSLLGHGTNFFIASWEGSYCTWLHCTLASFYRQRCLHQGNTCYPSSTRGIKTPPHLARHRLPTHYLLQALPLHTYTLGGTATPPEPLGQAPGPVCCLPSHPSCTFSMPSRFCHTYPHTSTACAYRLAHTCTPHPLHPHTPTHPLTQERHKRLPTLILFHTTCTCLWGKRHCATTCLPASHLSLHLPAYYPLTHHTSPIHTLLPSPTTTPTGMGHGTHTHIAPHLQHTGTSAFYPPHWTAPREQRLPHLRVLLH